MNEEITLRLERLAYGGDVVGRHEGKATFAAYGLPGEEVRVVVSEERKSFVRGRVVEVVGTPSPNRVVPRCEYFGACGGCQWQHMDYAAQVAAKGELLVEQLRRIGGLDVVPLPAVAAPLGWDYRNLARLQVRYPREGGTADIGYYRRESHSIIPIERCYIVHPHIVALLEPLGRLVNTLPRDALTAITVRASFADNSTYLLLHQGTVRVNSSDIRRALSRWVKFQEVDTRFGMRGIATVSRLIAPSRHPSAKPKDERGEQEYTDLGGEAGELLYDASSAAVLWGEEMFSEKIGGAKYQFPPAAFFQVNSAAAESLAELVREAIAEVPLPEGKRTLGSGSYSLIDLYSGVGLFSLHLLATKTVRSAIGIEVQNAAVRAARVNAEAQGLVSSCDFYDGRVEDVLPELLAEGMAAPLMIADPPRSGLSPAVIAAIVAAHPRRFVYVSCDPSTLARDLKALAPHYRLVSTRVVDMFPQTYHIESVSVLDRLED